MDPSHPIKRYFLPQPSQWPVLGALGLFLLVIGIVNLIHNNWYGHYLFMGGAILITFTMFSWFSLVINESLAGLHSIKMDKTYRWAMAWFIASEVAFFWHFLWCVILCAIFCSSNIRRRNRFG